MFLLLGLINVFPLCGGMPLWTAGHGVLVEESLVTHALTTQARAPRSSVSVSMLKVAALGVCSLPWSCP